MSISWMFRGLAIWGVVALIATPVVAQEASGAKAPAVAKPHDFARWEKEIAAMEAGDKVNPPPKNAVLFIGSSSVRMWKTLAQDFPNHKVINRGFGGSQIIDAAHFADRLVFPHEPKAIFLFSGGNDINAGKTHQQVFGDFRTFVTTVRTRLPEVPIYYISFQPRISRWKQNDQVKALNNLIADWCREQPNLTFIDTWDMTISPDGEPRPELFVKDNLHFSQKGYERLVEMVKPYVEEIK